MLRLHTIICFAFILYFAVVEGELGKVIELRFPKTGENYQPRSIRRWKFDTDEGQCLEFRLKGLNTEVSEGCSNDYIDVYDGDSTSAKRKLRTCGIPDPVPGPIRSSSNKIFVVFNSDANQATGRGFEATLTTVSCGSGSCGKPHFSPRESSFHSTRKRRQASGNNLMEGPPILFNLDNEEVAQSRIVGGEEARPNSWPWQVSIRWRGRHICGGTLVSRTAIVSAAHCFKTVSLNPSEFEFWVGKHQKDNREPDTEQLLQGEEIILHPRYEVAGKHDSDLAIIRVRSPGAYFNKYVSPICLPLDYTFQPADGAKCYVSGYGSTHGTGHEQVLKQATLPIIGNEECAIMEPRLQRLITANMLCAGYEKGGHDSCQGDSGGPLVCKIGPEDRWVLSGVVSYGFGCAGKMSPGVYVRITQFLPWLRQQIRDFP